MQNIESVEQAYQAFGKLIHSFVEGRKWDVGACEIQTWPYSTGLNCWLSYEGVKDEKGDADRKLATNAMTGARYIRDDMLKTTGNRIWAMTVLLYPNNEIKITYNYDKPADYPEPSEDDGKPLNVFESVDRMIAAGVHFGGVTETRPKDKDEK
jgi:hypothetical protein